jgi:hypothetical protein
MASARAPVAVSASRIAVVRVNLPGILVSPVR